MKAMAVPQFAVPAYDDELPLLIAQPKPSVAHSAKKRKRPAQAFRLQCMFWLDLCKPEQEKLADLVEYLKERRLFAATVRDGIQLICDLRAGRLDTLLALFPWIEEAFYQRFTAQKPALDTNIAEQLARLEQLLLTPPAGPRPLSVPTMPAPANADDDDEPVLVLKKAESDGTTSAKNFLDSAFSLIQ